MDPLRLLGAPPGDPGWGHARAPATGGVELHYVRLGTGRPVVLLHGWPGFWYDWRAVLPRLAAGVDAVAPDLRGFGDSDRPDLPPAEDYTPEVLAADVLALLDHLEAERAVVAAHDLGASVAQVLARTAPERVAALVLLNPPYPGIGRRRFDPAAQREFWYQHFHALPWSDRLVGHDRETVRLYLAHFHERWVGRKEALREEEFEAVVDVYARPGAVRASFAYYRARAEARAREAALAPEEVRVEVPTWVVWGEADPVIPVAWSDRLPEFFPQLRSFRRLPGVGHFVPWEAPEEVAATIFEALRG